MKNYLSLLLSLLLFPGVLAAQATDENEKPIPFYDVELIIFKNNQVPKGREFALPVSSPGKSDPIMELSSQASVAAASKFDYKLLEAGEYRMMEPLSRLIESPRYDVLLHAAWRQPGLERKKVLPVWIKGGRIYGEEFISIDSQIELIEDKIAEEKELLEFDEQNLEQMELKLQQQLDLEQQPLLPHGGLYELEGKITIALSRYLHTYVDLVFRRPRLSIDPALDNPVQDQYLATYAADTRILNNHRMKEHRRMRSKNLHYLDSPEFSMLILITPYEQSEELDTTASIEDPEENEAEVTVVAE